MMIGTIGNFTDPEAYSSMASSVQEVAVLLLDQGKEKTSLVHRPVALFANIAITSLTPLSSP